MVQGVKDCGKDFNAVKHMLSSIFMIQKQQYGYTTSTSTGETSTSTGVVVRV